MMNICTLIDLENSARTRHAIITNTKPYTDGQNDKLGEEDY